MGTEKPFCTVDVMYPETAAYLYALGYWIPSKVLKECEGEDLGMGFTREFPGGLSMATELAEKTMGSSGRLYLGNAEFRSQLVRALRDVNITETSAPWLKREAPTEIDGNAIDYQGKDGIQFGCNNQYNLSLEQMELMVAKCKEAE